MPRDLDMLMSLSEARYLTAPAIEWLHWASWRTRWQQWTEQDAHTRRPYRPSTWMYDRLQRLETLGLILKIRRPASLGTTQFKRASDVYALSERGADLLCEMHDVPRGTLDYDQGRMRSWLTLAHSVAIGHAYAALRAKIATKRDLVFAEWHSDAQLAKAYDRIAVRVPQPNGSVISKTLPIQPDGTFVLWHAGGSVRVFIEVDRGRRVTTWRDKIYAYHAYTNSAALHKRYGTTWFVLLTITTTDDHRRKLMAATAQIVDNPGDRYLFAVQSAVHPTTIGSQWHKIGQRQPTVKHLPGNQAIAGVDVEPLEHVFIR